MQSFQRLQYRFAAHLRDPKRRPAPRGVEPRRMKIYRELFYNNVEGFLASAFPVLRTITPDRRWHAMVRDFYARHESRDPVFQNIAHEFLVYLEKVRRKARGDPPYLRELAHYEWAELALSVSTVELSSRRANPAGDLLDGVPVLSPLAWLLACAWPVHRIGPGYRPRRLPATPTFLAVYRNRADEVRFMELNAVTARLLQRIRRTPATGRAHLRRIARELKHPNPEDVIRDGAAVLQGLRERDIILGTRRKGS
jgi:uncharacterized protein